MPLKEMNTSRELITALFYQKIFEASVLFELRAITSLNFGLGSRTARLLTDVLHLNLLGTRFRPAPYGATVRDAI